MFSSFVILYVPAPSTIVVSAISEFAATSNASASPALISMQFADVMSASSQEWSGYAFSSLSPHAAMEQHKSKSEAFFMGRDTRDIVVEDLALFFSYLVGESVS